MVKRYFLPGFTFVLIVFVFILFSVLSNANTYAYPPFSYPGQTSIATGTAVSVAGAEEATPAPQLFLPGLYNPSLGSAEKGLAWSPLSYTATLAVHDAEPFHLNWYYDWDLTPPPALHRTTVGGEFIPMQWCWELMPSTPLDYSGYLLFLNEPDNTDPKQCGGHITGDLVEESVDIYEDIREAFPNAKLIGPNITFQRYNDSITGFLEAWRAEVLNRPGLGPDALPDGYAIHIYSAPNSFDTAFVWVKAYCDKLYEWGELDKELWVTEFGWRNDWVHATDEPPTKQATINNAVNDQFGFFETGFTVGTPTPGAEHNCRITRYAWYSNRRGPVPGPNTPTPAATPVSGVGNTFLYWYFTLTRSYTGNAYLDFGNITPTYTPTP